MVSSAFTSRELRTLRGLKTPRGIQHFLDGMPYHLAGTAWSPRRVLAEQTAHCLEGALFAAAALRVLGFPALILDLEADQDTDHVIAVYQMDGHWGALAQSNFSGCRDRAPIYRTLRELVLSYFHIYFNLRGERTLRRFSRPVDLVRFDHLNWMTTGTDVWFIAEYLCEIPHTPLLDARAQKQTYRVDARTKASEMLGHLTKNLADEAVNGAGGRARGEAAVRRLTRSRPDS